MKYIAKANFKDGTRDAAGVVKNFSSGDEYNGSNVDALLSQGLIVESDVAEVKAPAAPVASQEEVAQVLDQVEPQQPRKKGKKKGD